MSAPVKLRPGRAWPAIIGLAIVLAAGVAIVGFVHRTERPPSSPINPPSNATDDDDVSDGPPIFADVTASTGFAFTYRNGEEADRFTILESLGGGVALFDYDRDGLLDIFVPGGGRFEGSGPPRIVGLPSKLFRNLGGWKFEDVTAASGLDKPLFYTHGAAVADYDRDGFPDLLVTGWDRVALYHNESDSGTRRRFVEVSEQLGLKDSRWNTSAAWGDLDGDGFPDLYVCYYADWSWANDPVCEGATRNVKRDVCGPQSFKPLQHRLYHNEAGKRFRDITADAPLRPDGFGLGVVILDLDADGRPDIYVANDGGDNFLYLNRGNLRFEEKGMSAGAAVGDQGAADSSMGVDVGDYEGTGRPSLFVTNFQHNLHALYQCAGPGRFRHQSLAAGLGRMGRQYVGWGTGFFDYDNDGWEDLVYTNGHVWRYPVATTIAQQPFLLHNEEHEGRRQFRTPPGLGGPYFQGKHFGRGLAIGDLDNDGWPDLVISHQNTPVVLLRNVWATSSGRSHHWLGFSLRGKSNRDLVGTIVTLEVGGRNLTRFVKGGGSYLSASDSRILFGLGSADKVGKLTVRWPGGAEQRFDVPAVDQFWRIDEGDQAPRSAATKP